MEDDDLDGIKGKLIQDLIVNGTASYKAFIDDQNKLKIRYVDPFEPIVVGTDNIRTESLTIEQVEERFGKDMANKVKKARKDWNRKQNAYYKDILDDCNQGEAFSINMPFDIARSVSNNVFGHLKETKDRIDLFKKLSSLGSVQLDKRIYKKKK